jgi:hypothetical protein
MAAQRRPAVADAVAVATLRAFGVLAKLRLTFDCDHAEMDFGKALGALKDGEAVARQGWNGKNMWLSYSPGVKDLPAEKFWSDVNGRYAVSRGGKADVLPCITMKTATGEILMGWLASQSDMLAEDWMIVSPIQ